MHISVTLRTLHRPVKFILKFKVTVYPEYSSNFRVTL